MPIKTQLLPASNIKITSKWHNSARENSEEMLQLHHYSFLYGTYDGLIQKLTVNPECYDSSHHQLNKWHLPYHWQWLPPSQISSRQDMHPSLYTQQLWWQVSQLQVRQCGTICHLTYNDNTSAMNKSNGNWKLVICNFTDQVLVNECLLIHALPTNLLA